MCRVVLGVIFLLFFGFGFIFAQTEKSGYIDTHTHLHAQSAGEARQQKDSKRRPGNQRGQVGRPGVYRRAVPADSAGNQMQSGAAVDYDAAAKQLIAEMDEYGVQKALVMPPPQLQGRNAGSYQDLISLPNKYPGRIYFLGGGDILNKLIHRYRPNEVTPQIRKKFKEAAEEIIASHAKGFGEMTVLHFSIMNSHHSFEEAPADHPLFLLLADIAGSYNVPIDLHMEAVPQDMKTPKKLFQKNLQNPSMLRGNIPAFEYLLAYNPNAKIVWQHIGWDNTGFMTVELLRRLLESHSNLYLSMRGEERLFERNSGRLKPNRIVGANRMIRPEWVRLISDFPDRFMIGTDDFFGAPISTFGKKNLPTTSEETWSIVNQLSADLARKVGRDNAARVYNLD